MLFIVFSTLGVGGTDCQVMTLVRARSHIKFQGDSATVNADARRAVQHLFPLLCALPAALRRAAAADEDDDPAAYRRFTDERLEQALDALLWLERFLLVCHEPVKRSQNDVMIARLALHWNWLVDKALPLLLGPKQDSSLQVIIEQLQGILGHDSESSERQIAIWNQLGHCRPFSSQDAAMVVFQLTSALQEADLHVGSKRRLKLGFWLTEGPAVKQLVLQILERANSATSDAESGDVDEGWRKVQQLLQVHGLYAAEEDATGARFQQTGVVSTRPEDDHIEHQTALLPLYDLLALKAQTSILCEVAGGRADEERVRRWLDFNIDKTTLSALHLAKFKMLLDSSDKERHRELFGAMLVQHVLQLQRDSAVADVDGWTRWREDDGEPTTTKHNSPRTGNYVLYTSPVSQIMRRLIWYQEAQDGTEMLTGLTLGDCDLKLKQLSVLTNLLWKHAADFCTSDPCIADAALATSSFAKLISAVLAVFPENTTDTSELEEAFSGVPVAGAVWEKAERQLKMLPLDVLVPGYQDVVSAAVCRFKECVNSRDSPRQGAFRNGQAFLLGGLLQTYLLAPQGPVDPAEKQNILLNHAERELEDIASELEVRNMWSQLHTGFDLDLQEENPHPRLAYLLKRKKQLLAMAEELRHNIAFRPQPSQFPMLLQDVQQFLRSVVDVEKVLHIADHAQQLMRDAVFSADPQSATGKFLSELLSWQNTLQQFVLRTETQYPLYADLLSSFLAGVAQILHGVNLVRSSLQATLEVKSSGQLDRLSEMVVTLTRFPTTTVETPSSIALVEHQLLPENAKIVAQLAADDGESKQLISRYFKRTLLLAKNHLQNTGNLDMRSIAVLSHILGLYVNSWQTAEETRKQRELEQESLYKFRSKTHGTDLTEEQQEYVEMREAFPTFEKDFEDINVGFTADEKQKPVEFSESPDNYVAEDRDLHLTEEEMAEVCHVHIQLFSNLTKSPWIKQSLGEENPKTTDHTEAVILGYSVAGDVIKTHVSLVDNSVDKYSAGSHLVMCRHLTDTVSKSQDTWKKPYDIYRDANPSEALQCRPVLDKMKERVKELLSEWPDHPTLKQLVTVVDRIKSFPVTSPVMKLVSGLELLLAKAREWEQVAAAHVSLAAPHLESVTQLVIRWRKLELQCWSSSLDTVAWKCERKACKWWFHLYQIVNNFVQQQTDPEEQQSESSMLKALEQFVETSTVGEFQMRLKILFSFHCQLLSMDQSEKQGVLLKILWNIHQHYIQFLPNIQDRIAKIRQPIEKQLKGFVKIARWNDLNFWALKSAVEKTHKTVFKHTKEFEKALQTPVRPFLTADTRDWMTEADEEGIWDKVPVRQLRVEKFVAPEALKSLFDELSLDDSDAESFRAKLPKLFVKMRQLSRRAMQRWRFGELNESVDELTGEIISATRELQMADVTQGVDKEKQKSEAKHIHTRKRKALADLFKHLTLIGLSYRKGMLLHSHQDPGTDSGRSGSSMLSEPLDVDAALQQVGAAGAETGTDGETRRAWSGCAKYMLRCVSRRALFAAAQQAPSSELGGPNLQRCKGFSEHLMSLVQHKWDQMALSFRTFFELRRQIDGVQKLVKDRGHVSEKNGFAPQSDGKQWLKDLKDVVDVSKEGLEQMNVVLGLCPTTSAESTVGSPIPERQIPSLARVTQNDPLWEEARAALSAAQERVKEVKSTVDQLYFQASAVITWADIDVMSNSFDALSKIEGSLEQINQHFQLPGKAGGSVFSEALSSLRSTITSAREAFGRWLHSLHTSDKGCDESYRETDITALSESVCKEVLLVIQNVVKKQAERVPHETAQTEHKENGDEEPTTETLAEGLLTQHLGQAVDANLEIFRAAKVSHLVNRLLEKVSSYTSECLDCQRLHQDVNVARIVFQCLPLLVQYTQIYQCLLTHAITSHRSSAKLLSVLLSIFTELTTKGFCLPAEMSDDMGGEGATQFEDIEGGGLGEGEGVKDVSEQIESEDQLDEARKQGEEKQEQDPSNEPDVRPEDKAIERSEDFEGKMQDLEPAEDSDGSEAEEEQEEPELDKQMGDLGDEEGEKLDEQLWGEDEPDEEESQEKKEEFGPGAGDQTESELVAKDDNEDNMSSKEDKKEHGEADDKEQNDKENETKPHELDNLDDREYDENEADAQRGAQDEAAPPDVEDLPRDMELDEDERDAADDETPDDGEEATENPYDIDKMKEAEDEKLDNDEHEDHKDEGDEHDADDQETEENKDSGVDQGRGEEEPMETDEGEQGTDSHPGFQPQVDEGEQDPAEQQQDETRPEDAAQAAETAARTQHDSQQVQQSDAARDAAGDGNEQDEAEGVGLSQSEEQEGHKGDRDTSVARGGGAGQQQQRVQRTPGQSDADRVMGSVDEKVQKRLKTIDSNTADNSEAADEQREQQSDLYEHVKDAASQHDAQTMDAATDEQAQQQQPVPNGDEEEAAEELTEEDVEMQPDDEQPPQQQDESKVLKRSALKSKNQETSEGTGGEEGAQECKAEIYGEKVMTHSAGRGPTSTYHTAMELVSDTSVDFDLEKLRSELERDLHTWSHPQQASADEERAAAEAWLQYETLTTPLAQELSEQLRLVLEPTQASKLRGDYRTGKRLNMRKVIPYIASQFRKDKIWLRRTKPSKRQYQVMVAVDDSSSMADNHSKQLAFESLAVISNALTLLEVGELAICSFGESVKLLHPFHEQFTNQSGSKLLQQFTFEQRKTKIAQLLDYATATMLQSRSRQHGAAGRPETAQLLLIVSDGRGLFLEGVEMVRTAVRRARHANVFLVFVIIDNPQNKDSILDIRVPVFSGAGQRPEFKSYMDTFPFPFYVILRDINSLPHTLSDALRQWFELVTAADK